MTRKNYRGAVLFEIFVMVIATFATSYIIYESSKIIPSENLEKRSSLESKVLSFYKKIIEFIIGDKGFVSAESQVYTCVRDKNGSICQEYPILNSGDIEKCNSACNSTCLPATKNKVEACKPGVCYDSLEGVCLANSPKAQCIENGGIWKADSFANIPECQRGCCFLGDQTFFATSQECKRKASVLGITQIFKPEVRTELECLVQAKSQEEGACVFEEDFENTCKFGTRLSCTQMNGKFYPGLLCSNPELKTNCKPQVKTACVDDKDGVYWFDSCGNPENIYDANKVKSYNDGKIANESCAIGTPSNPLANQDVCGNCNYLLGSRCGAKTNKEKLADSNQDFVCRDLRCKDSQGNSRQNGESWCAYQGAIGVDKGSGFGGDGNPLLRSIDTPGSRHFRQTCIDGEVQTEPCADYRNEICVEADTALPNGNIFRSAACRLNRWQQCLDYNNIKDSDGKSDKEGIADKCEKNDDCFIKEVAITDKFRFNVCMPKYPSGFDLTSNGKSAEDLCKFASNKCTVVYIKGWGGWECKVNCECETKAFAEQMNDFCMSIGDCGASTNYIGEVTDNTKVKNSPKLDGEYLNSLKSYKEPVKGKVADPGNISGFYGEVGIPEGLGQADYQQKSQSMMMGMVAGAAGVALIYAAQAGWLAGTFLATTTVSPALASLAGTGASFAGLSASATTAGATAAATPALTALGGALAGAAIGFAAVSILIKFLVPGMDPTTAMVLSAAGAVGGAMVGYAYMAGWEASGMLGPIGIVILVIVLIVIVIAAILGIGKKKEIIVEFKCNPWQAPLGGSKCNQCGKDNGNAFGNSTLPCSQYQCSSLGQTCELLNQGTGKEMCVDVNPKDVTAPMIRPLQGVLANGSSYEKVTDTGFSVRGSAEEGCFKSNTAISLGVELNEAGQCRFDVVHTNKFDDMGEDFGGSLFLYNHSMAFSVPSLESLGLPGYDPNRKADYNLYLRCRDKRGNANTAEYTINFCIKPGNDLTPPIVTAREPISEWIRYNTSYTNAIIYTNEPAECKWSKTDSDYDVMNYTMSCDNELTHQQLQGWKCSAQIPVLNNSETAFIRCKDQPWIIESNENGQSQVVVNEGQDSSGNNLTRNITLDEKRKRNKNMESYEYVIRRSESPLQINSIKPSNETLVFGTEPASVDLEAETLGGVDGNAICSYKWGDDWVLFYETGENVHRQQFQSFFSGNKEIEVKCEDIAGNIATIKSVFKVEIDRAVPYVTRAFNKDNMLYIVTNKPAQCSYSLSGCGFEFQNGTLMSGDELVHTGDFSQTQTTYIKCKDRFGNVPGECSIKVRSE